MRKLLATMWRAVADRFDAPQVLETAFASTQFAGSGLVVNLYGCDEPPDESMSWAIRNGGVL